MSAEEDPYDSKHQVQEHTEHGRRWLTCLCGAAWAVVDCTNLSGTDYEGYERISDGEEGFHDETD